MVLTKEELSKRHLLDIQHSTQFFALEPNVGALLAFCLLGKTYQPLQQARVVTSTFSLKNSTLGGYLIYTQYISVIFYTCNLPTHPWPKLDYDLTPNGSDNPLPFHY